MEELVAREPFRERLCYQLMLALYRSGRQAEALECYRRTRQRLVDELGIEPSERLQRLQGAILRQEVDELPATPASRPAPTMPRARRRGVLAVAIVLALGGVATAAAVDALRDDAESPRAVQTEDAAMSAFVVKLENFLTQSRAGRVEVASTIDRAAHCELGRDAAVARLGRVQRNRQSLLQQVAALSVPDNDEALRAADLLQQSIQASISADWHYRDWLRGGGRCPPTRDPDLTAALRADAEATRAKRLFVAAFNPLARRAGKPVWTDEEF